jgi:hypothetical protein
VTSFRAPTYATRQWNALSLDEPFRYPGSQRVYLADDLFRPERSPAAVHAVLGVVAALPQHTFLALTDHAASAREAIRAIESAIPTYTPPWERLRRMAGIEPHVRVLLDALKLAAPGLRAPGEPAVAWPLGNLWLGLRVPDEGTLVAEAGALLGCPAGVRWLALEPHGPVDLRALLHLGPCPQHPGEVEHGWGHLPCDCRPFQRKVGAGIEWITVGTPRGQSLDLADLRFALVQGRDARVPVWVERLGAGPVDHVVPPGEKGDLWRPWRYLGWDRVPLRLGRGSSSCVTAWPPEIQVRELPDPDRRAKAVAEIETEHETGLGAETS